MTPEAFLVRLYSDDEARRRFLVDPEREVLAAGLDPHVMGPVDRAGLEIAAGSFARKRAVHAPSHAQARTPRWRHWWRRIRGR